MTPKNENKTWAIIMMAGMGTRMKSEMPKVLHRILGHTMVEWVLNSCHRAGVKNRVLVVGHRAEKVIEKFPSEKTVLQEPQLGTGHAVMVGLSAVPDSAKTVLILSGDVPCLSGETIRGILDFHHKLKSSATMISFMPPDPSGYGRIIRDDEGNFTTITEHKDLKDDQCEIEECNSGIYAFDFQALKNALKKLKPSARSKEYHLPDVLKHITDSGGCVNAVLLEDWTEAMGINTRVELAEATDYLRYFIAEGHMLNGVTIVDPSTTYIGPAVKLARDVTIMPGSILMGETQVGSGSVIGPYTELVDVQVGKNSVLRHSVLIDCRVDNNVTVGPYAHIRPGTRLRDGAHVGDFVEMKKTDFGAGSKAGHLTYLGDTVVGKNVNVGAGTITCNYDGKKKHQTKICDGVFIGSNTIIVAPLKVGKDAYTAAGSTLNKDVPANSLAFGRARQHIKKGWVKNKKESETDE